jgi:acyl-CoA hydrolase
MGFFKQGSIMEGLRTEYPEKFTSADKAFKNIQRGNKIYIGTAAGEPKHLVRSLMEYLNQNPQAFFDVDIYHVWTLLDDSDVFFEKYKRNFRIKSFFIGDTNRDAINKGDADYTPVFTSRIPNLFERKVFPIDIALVQVSPPDEHGYFNLGVGVDITKAAVENAGLVIAQVNSYMPRVHGDGFIHINDIDYIIPYDEPLPEYDFGKESEIALQVGRYVASLVRDGDTLQIGYGHIPLGVLSCLSHKRHLGIHTDLITDAIVDLIKKGVIDNSKKSINKGKTIGTYCLGSKQTYDFVNNNPCFRLDNLRFRDEYYDMCMQLRKILNKGWALGAGKQ